MRWTSCVVVIGLMTVNARIGVKAVVVVNVAVGTDARRHGVLSDQCEARVVVVKG